MNPTDWYFTAPWDPVSIRRGDALGLRAGADYFADLLAPGLSNGTTDARWISILSWCLKWSRIAWHGAGGGDLSQRDVQRARYAWLRPLELLWVDRALESGQTTGQLRGRRSIERWRKNARKASIFAMSQDQFRRYRQVGTYGAYRVIFRTISGLTNGDGWTPEATALKLADIVNKSLPVQVQLKQVHFDKRIHWGNWSNGKEPAYWIKHGWSTWGKNVKEGKLPSANDNIDKCITDDDERKLLEDVLFSEGSIRRVVANALADVKSATSHLDLCNQLANNVELKKIVGLELLELLPAFSRLADAAMHAMRGLWAKINQDGETPIQKIEEISNWDVLEPLFEQLKQASEGWLGLEKRRSFPHGEVATKLAEAMCGAKTPLAQLKALAQHHHEYGGGRRWFREQDGKLVRDTGSTASNYRFRLRSLCLLAAQCGVANMDQALSAMNEASEEENEEDDE